jgi:hypothetical protein
MEKRGEDKGDEILGGFVVVKEKRYNGGVY